MGFVRIQELFVVTILTVMPIFVQADQVEPNPFVDPCRDGQRLAERKPYANAIMMISTGEDAESMGTAFRVGPDTFVTAAHVVRGLGIFGKKRTPIRGYPTKDVVDAFDVFGPVERSSVPLQIVALGKANRSDMDYAVLKVDRSNASVDASNFLSAMPILPVEKSGAPLPEGTQIVSIGFPSTCGGFGVNPRGAVIGGYLRGAFEGTTKSLSSLDNLGFLYGPFFKFKAWADSLTYWFQVNRGAASPGVSGGPVIVEHDGQPKVVGIVIRGVSNFVAYVPLNGELLRGIKRTVEPLEYRLPPQ